MTRQVLPFLVLLSLSVLAGATAATTRSSSEAKQQAGPVLIRVDHRFHLDGEPITPFGIRAANAIQDDEITQRFIDELPAMREHGIQSFTITVQGGRHTYRGNSAFNGYHPDGSLVPEFANRLTQILDVSAELAMVPVIKFFYRGRDQELEDEQAVRHAVINTLEFLRPWRHAWVSVMNEPDHPGFDHSILTTQRGQIELYELAKSVDPERIVYVSHVGGANDGFIADTWGRQESLAPPRNGDVSVEYSGVDSHQHPGVFSDDTRKRIVADALDTVAQGGYFFMYAIWNQRADGPGWPRFHKGGKGTADDPGTGFIWDAFRDYVALND